MIALIFCDVEKKRRLHGLNFASVVVFRICALGAVFQLLMKHITQDDFVSGRNSVLSNIYKLMNA